MGRGRSHSMSEPSLSSLCWPSTKTTSPVARVIPVGSVPHSPVQRVNDYGRATPDMRRRSPRREAVLPHWRERRKAGGGCVEVGLKAGANRICRQLRLQMAVSPVLHCRRLHMGDVLCVPRVALPPRRALPRLHHQLPHSGGVVGPLIGHPLHLLCWYELAPHNAASHLQQQLRDVLIARATTRQAKAAVVRL